MATVITMPGAQTAAERILSRYSRAELEGFVEVAIALLDLAASDPDLEPDEPDHEHDGREEDWPLPYMGDAAELPVVEAERI